MNISYDNSNKVSGVLTVAMEKADYQERVDKTLKSYRKKSKYTRVPSRTSSYGID